MGRQSRQKKNRAQQGSGDAELDKALAELTPEQAEMFVAALELAMKKRRLMLLGYLSAALCILLGTIWAFVLFANREPGEFIGWVFLIPFCLAGASMMLFGRLARRLKK